MEEVITNWLLYIVLGLVVLYIYNQKYLLYWKNQGIPYLTPIPFIGTTKFLKIIFKTFNEVEEEYYKKYGPLYGYFQTSKATLVVADPELIKLITVKDFHIFTNRPAFPTSNETLSTMLFNTKNEVWKRIRNAVTPTFTTGRMRKMSHLVNECAQSLLENLREHAIDKRPADIKAITGAFTLDVISSTAFGTRIDSYKDPKNPIVENAQKVFGANLRFIFPLLVLFPRFFALLGKVIGDPIFQNMTFFEGMTKSILEERKKGKNANRGDFLQLMIDTQKNTDQLKNDKDTFQIAHKLTEKEMFAQCVSFFIAGFDTTATTITMSLFLLAWNEDEQRKVQEQIDSALSKNNGEINYDVLKSIPLAEAIVSETMRIYSPAGVISREPSEDYVLGDTGVTIPKGAQVVIPTAALQMDPKYFPEPEKFKPERFLPENKDSINPYAYAPFGIGPRNCVAIRFALMEASLALVHTLRHFNFKPSANTKRNPEITIGQFLLQPKNINLDVEIRSH